MGTLYYSCVLSLYIGLTITGMNVTLPEGEDELNVFASLVCSVEEPNFNLSIQTVEIRWMFNGTVINESGGRYFITNGDGLSGNYETILLIQQLIYSDAGIYRCEVRDIRDNSSPGPWISDEVNLQLLGTAIKQ